MVGEAMDLARQVVKGLVAPMTGAVQQVRGVAAGDPGLAVLVMVALLVGAVRALRGDRLAALVLIPLSFAWVLLNGPFEGPTLFVVSRSHGVTMADLISLVGLLVASWRLVPGRAFGDRRP